MNENPKVNLDKVSKQRAALRKAIEDAGGNSTAVLQDIRAGRKPEEHSLASLSSLKKKITSRIAGNLADVDKNAKTVSLKEKGALTKAKEQLRADKKMNERTVLDANALRHEIGSVYDDYMVNEHEGYELDAIETDWLRSKTSAARLELAHIIGDARRELNERRVKLGKENPREDRACDLTTYVDELSREGHIAQTPYVNQCLNRIAERMRTGKPIFLHGPTGTGKTSLARRAAKSYSGHDAEMVYCNPQTRESNIWGKTGIRPTEGGGIETVDVLGPLARAMQEGKPVIFDEFTALPKEQMVFIKGVFNAKPGDPVNVVGNGRVTIQPGFQMIFTANLKSDKNPERQELPPEIAREFEQNNLEVFYNPPNEAFDIMLARLMQPDGSVQMSWYDLNTTLPKFCEALREIQIAYYDRERPDTAKLTGTLEASGKSPSLKKFVMTQGTVEAILEAWNVQKERGGRISFTQFLDQRLAIGLTFKEYPESDRVLAAKILASKGLLRTLSPQQLGLPQDVFNFDAANNQRLDTDKLQALIAESNKVQRIGIMELADLDPFNTRKKPAAQAAQQFLTPEEQAAPVQSQSAEAPKNLRAFLEETFTKWYSAAHVAKATYHVQMADPSRIGYTDKKNQKSDATRFGDYTLNPDTQNIAFEKAKVLVPDLSSFVGKPLDEVMNHVVATYGKTHHVPGIEYWEWMHKNPDKVPQNPQGLNMKNGNYYFTAGSVLRDGDGNWNVPAAHWNGSEFRRRAGWLGDPWYSHYRVVLLER